MSLVILMGDGWLTPDERLKADGQQVYPALGDPASNIAAGYLALRHPSGKGSVIGSHGGEGSVTGVIGSGPHLTKFLNSWRSRNAVLACLSREIS